MRRLVVPAILLSLLAGSGSPASAQHVPAAAVWKTAGGVTLNVPKDARFDSRGNLIVLHFNSLLKFEGGSSELLDGWGGGSGVSVGNVFGATSMGLRYDDAVFITDPFNARIIRYSPSGVKNHEFGALGNGDGQFIQPGGVAVGPEGEVYVADTGNNRIQVMAIEDGVYRMQWKWGTLGKGNGEFDRPLNLVFGPDGDLYVSDSANGRIQVFEADGTFLRCFGTRGTGPGQLDDPGGIAVDVTGRVFVADRGNSRIQEFTSDGDFVFLWTGAAEEGDFDGPRGLAVGPDGRVYVMDTFNNRVLVFDELTGLRPVSWSALKRGK